ncbi:MAG: NUDIX hydrolase [Deltaproteobacteria bacterium]|nr:NUDIX hydrolase [Deltaproteobacteria bacterium]MBK8239329.1 NUDIX hydrolase [Deltaproteobacteria bacterium]MBK8719593.1 NUDIX hydrolase [Deltaproteobacteria bacterium]MBP7290883.1 NUDIX hydrolase [Nannocystaceae bacterium]
MSSRPAPWRTLSERKLASYRVFDVTELHAQRVDTGQAHTFFRIESVDWANIIPITTTGEVVMIRQFRHGAGCETLEIPGGLLDADEDPGTAAARELLEETGYRAGKVVALGSVHPNPALFKNRIHAFLATGCEKVTEIANDESEQTTIELVPVDAIDGLLSSGAIDHALVMAAFHWWRLRGSPTA